ncbi:SPOR domain-containing protein [Pontibacterium sp.]|uniref:SPOR domain-containing protein n=1 Tax=Pontibacterium sp. TaxID=2036026 RepID=UPI0035121535
MAARKDYASKKRNGKTATRNTAKKPAPPRKKAPVKAKKPFPIKLLLVTVLMTGALGYLLYSLVQVKPGSGTVTTVSKPTPKPKTEAKPAAKVQEKSKPAPQPQQTAKDEKRFEFYEMLPKSEVTTSDPTVYKSTPKTAVAQQQYLLQAGSFRSAQDADRMRAQLILLGLPNVRSEKTTSGNGIWYRVRTGPFKNRTELSAATNKLAKQNIFPLKIKAN